MTSLLFAPGTAAHAGPYSFPCTPEALAGTHPDTLRVYRNELFARHGRPFQSPDLNAVFGSTPWYTPDPSYTDDRLTDTDRTCPGHIQAVEAAPRTAPLRPDLDGDGTADPIRWDGHTLHLGAVKQRLVPGETSPMEYPPAVIVDLDLSDGHRELVVATDPGIEDEWQFVVVRLQNGRIDALMDAPAWMSHSGFSVGPHQLVHVVVRPAP